VLSTRPRDAGDQLLLTGITPAAVARRPGQGALRFCSRVRMGDPHRGDRAGIPAGLQRQISNDYVEDQKP